MGRRAPAIPGLRRAGPAQHGSVTVQRAPANCPRTYLCVYPKTNFRGTPKKVRSNNRNLQPYGGAFKYPLSAYNNGSHSVTGYEKPNYRGGHAKLNRGTGRRFIGSNLMTIYSNKWCVR
ncbi:peptidase inhibitor family I36 protein [Streptomyces platensis]|uniref:peptidase inhibitor family I36 protein n=1 Tax=Streptomyces platensis TaxID=58346 RepID=UPI002E257DF4